MNTAQNNNNPSNQAKNQPQQNPAIVDITSNTLAAQQMMGRGGQGFAGSQPGYNQPNYRPNGSRSRLTRYV
jgi:hypothetical protein